MADICEPRKVADFLLAESRERGEVLTNLKLQKLLYYAQAWHLALHGKPLFRENFRAWVHGPVLLSQYHRFKEYRWQPILEEVERPNDLGDDLESHFDEVLEVFGSETAVALEMMTHREAPWLEARGDLPPDEPSSAVIKKDTMGNTIGPSDGAYQEG
jgi:uncharacterized phage-associated protein